MIKNYATTIILSSTLFIGELHTFWEKAGQEKVNWIINKSVPMTLQWNIKFIGDEVNSILYFVAFWIFWKQPNRINKATVLTFLCLSLADVALYFWNFKTINFYYVYLCYVPVWLCIYKWGIKSTIRK